MTRPITEARFAELADAFGADLRRWPEAERAGAEALRDAEPARADALLAEADRLDGLMHLSRAAAPSAALRQRVVALAEKAGLRPRRTLMQRPSTWFSGVGWAAACAAGVLVGVQATAGLASDIQADSVLYQASLSGLDAEEVLG